MTSTRTRLAVALIAAAAACDSGEVRGFLVAKLDNAPPFIRRIQLRIDADTPVIRIPLARGKAGCEIALKRPDKLDVAAGNCKGVAGFGEVVCSDGLNAPLAWAMTSCRSGYGIILDNNPGPPRFSFGFANSLYGAMNQLDEVTKSSRESR